MREVPRNLIRVINYVWKKALKEKSLELVKEKKLD